MRVEDDGVHTFSHTSLSLWRLCKRRWYYRYVRHWKEPSGVQAAFSVELVHKPFEMGMGLQADVSYSQWEACFQAFETAMTPDTFHTLDLAKRVHAALRAVPPQLSDMQVEVTAYHWFDDKTRISARPDGLGRRYDGLLATVDLKYTEGKWQGRGRPWPVKALLPYDDQLLGQCLVSKAEFFARGTIRVNPASGEVAEPIWQEQPLDIQLGSEWLAETAATVQEIKHALTMDVFPKDEKACFAFGRPCPYMAACKAGWRVYDYRRENSGVGSDDKGTGFLE